ncbi:hypothetical protein D3C80_1651430 [compost metagenome]
MIGLFEAYPDFLDVQDKGYTLDSFMLLSQDTIKPNFRISPKQVFDMILFDYLIDNSDRHIRNFGIDSMTGTIAPLYDNACSFWCTEQSGRQYMLYENLYSHYHIEPEDLTDYLNSCEYSFLFLHYGLELGVKLAKVDFFSLLTNLRGDVPRYTISRYEEECIPLVEARAKKLMRSIIT